MSFAPVGIFAGSSLPRNTFDAVIMTLNPRISLSRNELARCVLILMRYSVLIININCALILILLGRSVPTILTQLENLCVLVRNNSS